MKLSPSPDIPETTRLASYLQTQNRPSTNQNPINEPPQAAALAEVTPEPKIEEERFSSKYAELAKREKLLRSKVQAREAALKAREDALKAKEEEYTSQYIPKTRIPEMFQKDPYQAMRDLGLSGDQLTQALLNQPSPQDQMIYELKQQLAELKSQSDQTKTSFDQRDKQAREQAVHQIRADVKSFVTVDPAFEIIKNTGSEDAVVEKIEKSFDQTGVIISIEDACLEVEKELTEELVKYSQLPKIQELLKAKLEVPSAVTETTKQQLPLTRAPIKTLANAQVPSASKTMSARDRAVAILEGRPIS